METKTINYAVVSESISGWLKESAEKAGIKGFVMGVSGGIDSAVVSTLCARTGLDLLVLEMPIHQTSAEVDRAQNHIQWLKDNYPNVSSLKIDLTEAYDKLYASYNSISDRPVTREQFDFSMANTRSRLRMTTLYFYAGIHKMLVAGTGNKVEDFGIGFYTKYGDGGVDLSPIGDLMKSEVYKLGRQLGVIEEILTAAPTDGLHSDGRTDEDQIGATYDELERAMNYIERNPHYTVWDLNLLSEREQEVLVIYKDFNSRNSHKMNPIPVFSTDSFR
jgi:NAD+ synthase